MEGLYIIGIHLLYRIWWNLISGCFTDFLEFGFWIATPILDMIELGLFKFSCNLLLLSSNFCKSYFFSWRSSLDKWSVWVSWLNCNFSSYLLFNISSTFLCLSLGCEKSHSEFSLSTSFSFWHLKISCSFESSLLSFSFERSLASAISSIELESTSENESKLSFDNGFEESILFSIFVTAGQPPPNR